MVNFAFEITSAAFFLGYIATPSGLMDYFTDYFLKQPVGVFFFL